MNYDWVYIGKEAYGTRHATSHAIKPGTKLFDVLGRAYDKMKARIKQYLSKPAIARSEYETALEFDVFARLIKDSEGNDIQAFIKEDKRNGLRRDSSFYWDGSWEVFEMKGKAETTLRNSLGITTSSIRDGEGKLRERILKDKDGKLIVNDKYVWKDGLLVKEIGLEGTRVYLYGKNPYEDTVRVIPSDKGHYFHKGYDGSAGMIPKKGEANYERFMSDPYGIGFVGNELNVLARKSGEYNFVEDFYQLAGIPIPVYHNPSRKDQCVISKQKICPENGDSENGGSDIEFLLKSNCTAINDCEKYKINSESKIWGGMWLQQSILRQSFRSSNYEVYYQRMCRTKEFLQETYYHEAKHFENALERRRLYTEAYIPKTQFNSFNECEKNRLDGEDYIFKLWNLWKIAEYNHCNYDSPQSEHKAVREEACDEIP